MNGNKLHKVVLQATRHSDHQKAAHVSSELLSMCLTTSLTKCTWPRCSLRCVLLTVYC